jgi:hypothetical protein
VVLFSREEGATANSLGLTYGRHHRDNRPDILPRSAPYDTCHVIRRRNNTGNCNSRDELFLHPANAPWAPNRIALPAATGLDSLKWLVGLLQRHKPEPAEPIKYAVQCRFEQL